MRIQKSVKFMSNTFNFKVRSDWKIRFLIAWFNTKSVREA